jgi:TfoX/Sxy family transcriptional regulator of competence genes
MATKQSTVDYMLDQLSSLKGCSARNMFGEYALYFEGKVVALVCDDTLFVKITDEGKKFVGKFYKEGFAYPGAKASMEIGEEQIEDREWLCGLIKITAQALPEPKPKKPKSKSR